MNWNNLSHHPLWWFKGRMFQDTITDFTHKPIGIFNLFLIDKVLELHIEGVPVWKKVMSTWYLCKTGSPIEENSVEDFILEQMLNMEMDLFLKTALLSFIYTE